MSPVPVPPITKPSMGQAMAVFGERRVLVMLGLGFSAGLPNLLIFDTLSAWLRTSGLSLEVIGFFGLATLSYSLKFLWAPLVDRTAIPLLSGWLGHRRSWMLLTQVLITVGLWGISLHNPTTTLGRIAALAALVGFCGATQDIVIDAWRIENAPGERQGVMATAYQWGYRAAIIVAGAAPLLIAERSSWNLSYASMAVLMGIGILAVLAAPPEAERSIRPIPVGHVPERPVFDRVEWAVRLGLIAATGLVIGTGLTGQPALLGSFLGAVGVPETVILPASAAFIAKPGGVWFQVGAVVVGLALLVLWCWPMPGRATRPGAYLAGSFGTPLREFAGRFGPLAAPILGLICLYRLADFVLNIMSPFYLDLGFTLTQLAEVRKVFGVAASMAGVFAGGLSVARLGVLRTMVVGAFASPLSNVVFAWLAVQGPDLSALFVAIGIDNFAAGYAGTALIAYMSGLTSAGFTATQYALFSSLYALPGKLIASQSGRLVDAAARNADAGGWVAIWKPFFGDLPAGSLEGAALKAGVARESLGSGYITFFFYSTALGAAAIVLAFVVARRQGELASGPLEQSDG